MLQRIPGFCFCDPATVPDEVLQAAWDLRATMMDIKPEVGIAADQKKVFAAFRAATALWIEQAPTGEALGIFCLTAFPRHHEGQPYLFIESEYTFVSPNARKGIRWSLGFVTGLLACIWKYPHRRIYMGGPGYPASVCVASHLGPIWMRNSPLPAWEIGALTACGVETAGMDPETGTVIMRTIPKNPRLTPPSLPIPRKVWERYLALNPGWTQGIGVFIWLPITGGLVTRALAELRRRVFR